MSEDFEHDPRFIAAIDMLRRTGVSKFRMGYTPEYDGLPVVWYAFGEWLAGSEAEGALNPIEAILRLLQRVIDGGVCNYCQRPTIFDPTMTINEWLDPILNQLGCVYAWDPELKVFRRECEANPIWDKARKAKKN